MNRFEASNLDKRNREKVSKKQKTSPSVFAHGRG